MILFRPFSMLDPVPSHNLKFSAQGMWLLPIYTPSCAAAGSRLSIGSNPTLLEYPGGWWEFSPVADSYAICIHSPLASYVEEEVQWALHRKDRLPAPHKSPTASAMIRFTDSQVWPSIGIGSGSSSASSNQARLRTTAKGSVLGYFWEKKPSMAVRW